jgi:predicted molibdopterin-dependent oxidoreductase YjgC
MCDAGRYGFSFIDAPSRITQPQLKAEASSHEVSWEDALSRLAREIQHELPAVGGDAVSVLASPALTNEALFLVWKLFRKDLGIDRVGFQVPDQRPATEDDFLIRADKNPNTRGAQVILPGSVDLLAETGGGGASSGILYLFEHDLVEEIGEEKATAFLSRFRWVVYQGSNENRTSVMAHLLLPAATYAETEGTFTNFEGRVQKIEEALLPSGDSWPHWKILVRLGQQLGLQVPDWRPEEVFADLASANPAFAGLTYDSIGDRGALLQK